MTEGSTLAGFRKFLVLIVDDDADILEALSEILEGEGLDVSRARNGLEALDRVAEQIPQVVLLDLMMPVMDGPEFARRFKQLPNCQGVPIIVLSAHRKVDVQASSIQATAFLAKPFDLDLLLQAVHQVLPV